MNKITAEFEKWFSSVEAGDDSEWREPEYQSREWHDYISRRQLALGAWNKALEVVLPVRDQQGDDEMSVSYSQFLSDVLTAAGLLAHGKKDKGLSERISKFCVSERMARKPATTPQIDNNGWIEWKGNNLPNMCEFLDVKHRSGFIDKERLAGWVDWENVDIIAYRVIDNDGREG